MVFRGEFDKGATGFETPHEFRPGKGVYVKTVEDAVSKTKSVKAAYRKAMEILRLFAPVYAGDERGEYVVVQFMRLDGSDGGYFKAHVDARDIDVQYLFSLGSGRCDTVIYGADGQEKKRVQYHERIYCMDGRLKHKLDTAALQGTRYSVVYFKLSDPRYKKARPVQKTGYYLSTSPPV